MKILLNTGFRYLWIPLLLAATHLEAASVIQFSASSYSVTENVGAAMLIVERSGDLNTVVDVDYASADVSATAGLDYSSVTSTLSFAAGETTKSFIVPILNDALVEPTETLRVILSNPAGGAVLGTRTTATVRITENDTGIQFEFGSYSVAEDAGSVLIGVVRGNDVDLPPFTADCATANGTATSGVDYTGVSNTLSFAAGEMVKLFSIPILNDGLKEPNETFRITLTNPTGGGVLGARKTATVTILDNDSGVQFEFNRYWVQENQETVTVKVLRGHDVDLPPFTVDFATTDGTAMAGQDYMETKGTLDFGAGETVKAITIPITYDEQPKADEKFTLTLSNPSAGTVLGANTTATITVLDTTGTVPHRFDNIAVLRDLSVQLTLGGGLHKRFGDYFDLYPIEVSTNLVDWTPLVTLQRTNSSTNLFTFVDMEAIRSDRRFYRTPPNHLITPFNKPTGPFPVGVASRLLTDPQRRNRYGVSTNGSFMISLWYPAVAKAGSLPGPFEDPELAHDPAFSGVYAGIAAGKFMDREPYFLSYALPDADCAQDEAPYPIVLSSSGAMGPRPEIAEKGPEIASHGYVVVATDPWDVWGTVFPDGTYLYGETNFTSLINHQTTATFQDRVADQMVVLDALAQWNKTDPKFAGRLNLTNVAVMGYSYGGSVAAELGVVEGRCKAVIEIEGVLIWSTGLQSLGLQKPCLSIYRQASDIANMFNSLSHDAIYFEIKGATHDQFSDYYWYFSNRSFYNTVTRPVNDYTLWFLNKYLKRATDPMPQATSYPQIFNFKQK